MLCKHKGRRESLQVLKWPYKIAKIKQAKFNYIELVDFILALSGEQKFYQIGQVHNYVNQFESYRLATISNSFRRSRNSLFFLVHCKATPP